MRCVFIGLVVFLCGCSTQMIEALGAIDEGLNKNKPQHTVCNKVADTVMCSTY